MGMGAGPPTGIVTKGNSIAASRLASFVGAGGGTKAHSPATSKNLSDQLRILLAKSAKTRGETAGKVFFFEIQGPGVVAGGDQTKNQSPS